MPDLEGKTGLKRGFQYDIRPTVAFTDILYFSCLSLCTHIKSHPFLKSLSGPDISLGLYVFITGKHYLPIEQQQLVFT